MRVFHHVPKNSKKADVIRGRLNNARDLRNRSFHHEPLLWQPIYFRHRDITKIVQWIDPGLCTWLKTHDRLPAAVVDWNNWKEAARRAAGQPSEVRPEAVVVAQSAQVEVAMKGDENTTAAKPEKKSRHDKPEVKTSVRVKADAQHKPGASPAPNREPARIRQVEIPPSAENASEQQSQATGGAGVRPILSLNRKKPD
ncbi:hypothetical protein [Pseudomonas umsongensis]|uniref:hypothetical protein n=1 Tax=Pseudomonas umsongensis TaxID=198618 RepID=UPI00177CF989|nr:hypothetical protein [Pseudomonas umsongensis]